MNNEKNSKFRFKLGLIVGLGAIFISMIFFVLLMMVGVDDKNFIPIYRFLFQSSVLVVPFVVVFFGVALFVYRTFSALPFVYIVCFIAFYDMSRPNEPIEYSSEEIKSLAAQALGVEVEDIVVTKFRRVYGIHDPYPNWSDLISLKLSDKGSMEKLLSGKEWEIDEKFSPSFRYRFYCSSCVSNYAKFSAGLNCLDEDCLDYRLPINLAFTQYKDNYL